MSLEEVGKEAANSHYSFSETQKLLVRTVLVLCGTLTTAVIAFTQHVPVSAGRTWRRKGPCHHGLLTQAWRQSR